MFAFSESFITVFIGRLMRKYWHHISLFTVTSHLVQWFVNRLCSFSLEVVQGRQSDFNFFPILITECWAWSWSQCTGRQPVGDFKPSTRLPLLSARPAVILEPYTWLAHIRLQAHYSFIDLERMKGWVDLVGWPVANGLPTIVVTHQLQVEHGTWKVCLPETDVLPLCHNTWMLFHHLQQILLQKNQYWICILQFSKISNTFRKKHRDIFQPKSTISRNASVKIQIQQVINL